jgi:hypothetical protein
LHELGTKQNNFFFLNHEKWISCCWC